MRIIGTLDSPRQAKCFSVFLRAQGIENTCEIVLDRHTDKILSSIWVHDEDAIEQGQKFFVEFQQNPEDPAFQEAYQQSTRRFSAISNPIPPKKEKVAKAKTIYFGMTYFFLGVCLCVFFLNWMQELTVMKQDNRHKIVLFTPIQYYLLFDAPVALMKLYAIMEDIPTPQDTKGVSEEVQEKLQEMQKIAFFRGFYPWMVSYLSDKAPDLSTGPMFVSIKQGQLWRLFTPSVLHKDFLHILFNMLWLWLLGKQIEMRLSKTRFLLMILIVGVISNTCQYLMSGPYFLGFSGVILGMAGFIWIRQKIAPWEGYPLPRTTLLFLLVFVVGMIGLQLFSFFMQISGKEVMFNIANTAHVSGALAGIGVGRLPFFSWRGS